MKKVISILLMAGALILMPVTAWADVADDPIVTLTYAQSGSETSAAGLVAAYFKEQVEYLSGGSISIDLYLNSMLGTDGEVIDNMISDDSNIDIAGISATSLWDYYDCNKTRLLDIPYTWINHDHYWNFASSALADEFLNEPHELGMPIRGLFYGECGFRHFFSLDPINSIEDFKGMKVRVPFNDIMNDMIEALGGNFIPISYYELYSALKVNIISCADERLINYTNDSFYEVAPNIIMDGHTISIIEVIIADSTWNKLTEEQQEVLREASRLAQEYNRIVVAYQENEALITLQAAGVNINIIDIAPWRNACAIVKDQFCTGYETLYQQLLNFAY